MANLAGYSTVSAGNMLNHYTRHAGDQNQEQYKYRNSDIDKNRTHLNYTLGATKDDPRQHLENLIKRVDVKPRLGAKATNVLSDIIVTLPRNEKLKGREREFFEQAYEFLSKGIPDNLILGAYVHIDETQPHMHFAFAPIVGTKVTTNDKSRPLKNQDGTIKTDKRGTPRYERVPKLDENGKPIERLSFGQSKIFNRNKLLRLHPQLEKHMTEYFGFKTGIELEDRGEKILSKLDQPDYIAAKETLKRQEAEKQRNLEALKKQDAEISKKQGLNAELDKANAEKMTQVSELESRVASATNELENIETQKAYEERRLEYLRRSGDRMEADLGALQARVSAELVAATAGKPTFDGSVRWDVRAVEECDQECMDALGDVRRAAGELAQTREGLAGRIVEMVERLTKIIVEKLTSGEWNPAHIVRNVGSDALDAFDKVHQQRVFEATDAAVGRWETRRAELKPQMDDYAEKIDRRVKDFRKTAKAWHTEGMAGEKPVFKLIKIPPDLAKYYEKETWEVRADAKNKVARARVKYGLETPAPGIAPLGGTGSYQQPQQRRPDPQAQLQQQQQRNVPTR